MVRNVKTQWVVAEFYFFRRDGDDHADDAVCDWFHCNCVFVAHFVAWSKRFADIEFSGDMFIVQCDCILYLKGDLRYNRVN